jgi:hypothetical protein
MGVNSFDELLLIEWWNMLSAFLLVNGAFLITPLMLG